MQKKIDIACINKPEIIFYKDSVLLFITVILIPILAFGQHNTKQIDELLDTSHTYYEKFDDLKSLEYAKKAYDLALENGTKQQIAESSFYIATTLISFQSYEEAFQYIKIAYENCPKENVFLLAKIIHIESNIYLYLGFYEEALTKSHLAVRQYKKMESVKAAEGLFEVYQNIATIFIEKNELDSASTYDYKAKSVLFAQPEKDTYHYRASYYFLRSEALVSAGEIDSAMYYAYKARELRKKYKDPMVFFEYITLGDCFYELKDYQKALENYLNAIENLENYRHYENDLLRVYKTVSQLYKDLGNSDKEKEYLQIYIDKENEINSSRKKSLDYAMHEILNKNTSKFASTQNKLIYLIIGITIIALILFWFYRKAQINKEKTSVELTKKETTVKQLAGEIEKSALEFQQMEQKVNESFEEILQMAKSNSPEFFTRFREVYPEVVTEILKISLKLRVSELTLCAYIFLGFTTKDIALYTYKSVNTVRNRRHNLRKKLDIVTEDSMELWLKGIQKKEK